MDLAVSVRAYDGVVPRPPPLRTERPEQGSPVGQYFVVLVMLFSLPMLAVYELNKKKD